MHLKTHDLTIARLHEAVEQVGKKFTLRIGPKEIPRLAEIMFEDGHRSCHELCEFPTLYAFVCTKMKRWGYIKLSDDSRIFLLLSVTVPGEADAESFSLSSHVRRSSGR